MAVANFIPELWSAKLLTQLEKSLVYGSLTNRDYEGEISQYGDTVHITSLTPPTVRTYTAHTDITIEDVDDTTTALTIDQSPYFAFEVDDIEKRQSRGEIIAPQLERAGYELRDVADKFVAGLMAAGVDAGNLLPDVTLSAANAYDTLVDLGVALDEANVPTEGRWVVITPAMHGFLLKDSRFVAAGDAQGATVRTNGYVGGAAGFAIHKSNNAPAGDATPAGKMVIAGSNIATTFAQQIAKVEAFKMELRFNDAVKGLHLYGAKVVRPTALAAVEVA